MRDGSVAHKERGKERSALIPLNTKKGTAREQLLELATHQARVQGKSVTQYLRELQAQVQRDGKGDTALRPVTPTLPREKYVYLTRREVELFFDQILTLRDRALFGTMYYFGLRASEVGLLLREYVNFRTRRIFIPRLKGGVQGDKVMTADCRRLLQTYLQSRRDALPYLFPSRNHQPISRKRIDALYRHVYPRSGSGGLSCLSLRACIRRRSRPYSSSACSAHAVSTRASCPKTSGRHGTSMNCCSSCWRRLTGRTTTVSPTRVSARP